MKICGRRDMWAIKMINYFWIYSNHAVNYCQTMTTTTPQGEFNVFWHNCVTATLGQGYQHLFLEDIARVWKYRMLLLSQPVIYFYYTKHIARDHDQFLIPVVSEHRTIARTCTTRRQRRTNRHYIRLACERSLAYKDYNGARAHSLMLTKISF